MHETNFVLESNVLERSKKKIFHFITTVERLRYWQWGEGRFVLNIFLSSRGETQITFGGYYDLYLVCTRCTDNIFKLCKYLSSSN